MKTRRLGKTGLMERNWIRRGMAGAAPGGRRNSADPLCVISWNQYSGLLDGGPEIQRYYWKRN